MVRDNDLLKYCFKVCNKSEAAKATPIIINCVHSAARTLALNILLIH
jgi:hypothetical protein